MDAAGRTTRASFASAWSGRAGKSFYLAIWLPALTAFWSVCFVLAWHAYPRYQMSHHDISYLGHPALNPQGWGFWSVGMGIASVMMFPPVAYASRRMEELTCARGPALKRLVSLGSGCLRASCLGLMGLALAPQSAKYDVVHQTAGVFAFGGMYLTLLFLWSVPLFKVPGMSGARLTIFLMSAWWGVLGFLSTQGYRFIALGELGHESQHKGGSFFLRFSLWEWMLFAAVTTSFVVFFAVLPARSVGVKVSINLPE